MMADGERTGGCMCGAVRFAATDVPSKAGICHCEMCRRWTGSALIGVTVPTADVVWEGEPAVIRSSDWAERGFCPRCGSGLWFRVTMEGQWFGNTELPLGIFDDADGFEVTNEIYIDHKPDSWAFEGQMSRRLLTRADCVEKFSVLESDGPED